MFRNIKRLAAAIISLAAVVQISSVSFVNAEEDTLYSTDFENEEVCWYAFGNTNSVELSDEHSNSGEFSLKASNRTNSWMGPGLDITEYFEYGPEYTVSFMAFQTASDASVQISATAKVYRESGGEDYLNVLSDQTVPPGEWTQVKGILTLPADLTRAEIYIETPNNLSGNIDFYIDDFVLYSGTMEVQEDTEITDADEPDDEEYIDENDDTEETMPADDSNSVKKKKKKNNAMIPILITGTLVLVAVGIGAFIIISKKTGSSGDDSDRDPLTKAYLKDKYEDKIREYQNSPEKLSDKYFSICEIVNMQKINADFGQAHGDEALMICAYLLQKAADKHGKIYRVSNERFVVISDKNLKNEIRQEIENQKKENKNYDIQIAFGYSYFDKKNDGIPNARVIVDRAETMMLSDKNKITAVQNDKESQNSSDEDILKTLESVKTIDTDTK